VLNEEIRLYDEIGAGFEYSSRGLNFQIYFSLKETSMLNANFFYPGARDELIITENFQRLL
jgi:hypothetical protein